MQEAEEILVDTLSRYGIPPAAGRNLIKQARKKSGLGDRPMDWVRLAEGPLLEEIQAIIPIFKGGGDYAKALASLRKLAEDDGGVELAEEDAPPPEEGRQVNLEDPRERERLLSELARENGAIGVALIRQDQVEMRFPGASENLPRLLYTAHRLFYERRPYLVGYFTTAQAQVFFRPLGEYIAVVVTRRGANLGRMLTRLAELQAKGGSK